MISIIRRYCASACHQMENSTSLNPHVYTKYVYSNLEELEQVLLNNIIFKKNGIIALNKPYGLKKESIDAHVRRKDYITKIPAAEEIDHLSFAGVLPLLSKSLKSKQLILVKVPERFISGVSMLAENEHVLNLVKKDLGDPAVPLFSYLAVCIGIPIKLTDRCKLGLTIRQKNEFKKAVLVTKYSKTSVKQDLVVPVTMNHCTLATNKKLNVSLVRIENNRNKWHAVRAYCGLRLLAPVFGDSFYGSCVRSINRQAVPVDPLSPLANYIPKWPSQVLSALELKEDQTIIPAHLHLSGLNLQKQVRGKILVAKPPDNFLWTCEKLNLEIPEIYLQNDAVDKSSYYTNSMKELS